VRAKVGMPQLKNKLINRFGFRHDRGGPHPAIPVRA